MSLAFLSAFVTTPPTNFFSSVGLLRRLCTSGDEPVEKPIQMMGMGPPACQGLPDDPPIGAAVQAAAAPVLVLALHAERDVHRRPVLADPIVLDERAHRDDVR